jgi:peptidoglycan/xylan/chitin deacetylase (PgdA/CDA1 family)
MKHYSNRMLAWSCFLLLGLLLPGSSPAKDVPFQIVPWNGYKAALSLTYDDGIPIQLDVAIPEMVNRNLRGTFYLISGKLDRAEEWKKILASGQEVGNHTVTHRHTAELTPADEQNEVENAKADLQKLFNVPVLTFAYPYVEESPGIKKWVAADNFIARGGSGSNYYLTPDMNPDWFDIPGQATMTMYAYDTYKNWVDQDLASKAWTVLMIHSIEGSDWYQPIPKATYLKFLDYLVQNQKDLWIAPFGEVGGYWRAQKVVEQAEPTKNGNQTVIRWEKPANFPIGVVLKLRIVGTGLIVSQGGREIKPISQSVYPVSFDSRELTLVNADWQTQVLVAPAAQVVAKPVVIDAQSITAAPDKPVLKLDDFESASPSFGGSWWEGCDSNGVTKLSSMPFTPLPGGSPVSPGHCAGLQGHLGPQQAPWPWATLSLGLDATGKPIDLTGYRALRFYTKGDGKTHSVALNKASVSDYDDFQAAFVSPADWTQVTIPFTDFAQAPWGKQLEKKFNDVTKLSFSPGAGAPDFDFKIDDVELVK